MSNLGEVIKNKKGEVQRDFFGKALRVGQPVLILNATYCKGGRSSISTGTVVGFNRYCVCLTGEHDQGDVHRYLEFLRDKEEKKFSLYDWQELDRRGMSNLTKDNVTPCYLIGCTLETQEKWLDGSLFE